MDIIRNQIFQSFGNYTSIPKRTQLGVNKLLSSNQIGNIDWLKTNGVTVELNGDVTLSAEETASVITFNGMGMQYVYQNVDDMFTIPINFKQYQFSVFLKLNNPTDITILDNDSLSIVGNNKHLPLGNMISTDTYKQFTLIGEVEPNGVVSVFISSKGFPELQISAYGAEIRQLII
jgi:hypothetical protein